MAFRPVCTVDQLPPGGLTEILIEDKSIALCNVDGQFHAIEGVCPHRNAPLGQGALHGKMVVCPWHAWEFDCTTGRHDYNPSITVATYPVKVDGEDILVDFD
ncbi:MAG: Rieske 2Fe-2S domain-containing protein [Bryobacterales bacterium]|nr:Rieske 2Fe-2S domain-containing protein [Bryobacterales bacterium]